jgi:glycerophosphoryl diester phosphodiesterase
MRPKIFAHQGGAAQWPANSLQAFEQIAKRAVDGVELDVHCASDGVIVVAHDAVIMFGDAQRAVASLTSRELRQSHGDNGAGRSFDEVLEILRPSRLDIQIDIKTDHHGRPYPALTQSLAALIAQYGLQDRVILSSFLPHALAEARSLLPTCRLRSGIMPLVTEQLGGTCVAIGRYKESGCSILDFNTRMFDAEALAAARDAAMEVGVGTINGAPQLRHWLSQPIDRVLTDEPDLALAVRERGAG